METAKASIGYTEQHWWFVWSAAAAGRWSEQASDAMRKLAAGGGNGQLTTWGGSGHLDGRWGILGR